MPEPLAAAGAASLIRRSGNRRENLGLWFNFFLEWNFGAAPEVDKQQLHRQAPAHNLRDLLAGHMARRDRLLAEMTAAGYVCRKAEVRTESRLAAGQGNPNPVENGMTFHQPLGFPIIPGSSLKGVAAAYAEIFEGRPRDGESPDPDVGRVFGGSRETAGRGTVLFFDAYPAPTDQPLVECDVLTPHYGKYYGDGGRTPPADYHSPIPNAFLTVPEGRKFRFEIAGRSAADVELAWEWLSNALIDLGVGGKTRAGYGRFRPVDWGNP